MILDMPCYVNGGLRNLNELALLTFRFIGILSSCCRDYRFALYKWIQNYKEHVIMLDCMQDVRNSNIGAVELRH